MDNKKKSSRNPNEIQRFSCGFYNYNIDDIVLTNILNFTTPKHLRGSEMKRLALLGLKASQPALYEAVYKEVRSQLGLPEEGIAIPTQVSIPQGASVPQSISSFGATGIQQTTTVYTNNTPPVETKVEKVAIEKEVENQEEVIKTTILEENTSSQEEENEIVEETIEEKPKAPKNKISSKKSDMFKKFRSNGG